MDTAVADPQELTAHDRCDRCGAQAKERIVFKSGELLFCAHHRRKHDAAIELQKSS